MASSSISVFFTFISCMFFTFNNQIVIFPISAPPVL